MKILLIDNYDSFTFNLFQLFADVAGVPPVVVRNDQFAWSDLAALDIDAIVISPGPGRPDIPRDFGVCTDAVMKFDGPILGVCLGHQGIGHLFGGKVDYADTVMHGRLSTIRHDGKDLFHGIPQNFEAVRYHSLIVTALGPDMEATAWTDDGIMMGARHLRRPIWGVQFHPESISTEHGATLARNFCDLAARAERPRRGTGAWPGRSEPDAEDRLYAPPSAAATFPESLALFSRRIDRLVDAERCFLGLFADRDSAFWLDSSLDNPDVARFSLMGDASGPLAEHVSYDVQRKSVVRTTKEQTSIASESIFDALKRWSGERKIAVPADIPVPFTCGWVGYLGYELKADCGAMPGPAYGLPDAQFIFADRVIAFDHREDAVWLLCCDDPAEAQRATAWLDETEQALRAVEAVNLPPNHAASGLAFRPHVGWSDYATSIARCKDAIRRGETYEVCLTNEFVADRKIDPVATYRRLRRASPAPHAAFLRFGEMSVLSSSPERFMRIDAQGNVEAKPIKGTIRRGKTEAEDDALAEELRLSVKNRSENLMIVDLLRNDMGRACEIGSIHVPVLFGIESFSTVHQLVSTVRGRLRSDLSPVDAIRAAFPGGSMTGAPKIRTMEILDELEARPRGVYSGAIGYFSLSGAVDLSIVIRTAVACGGSVSISAGGAIVDLSDIAEEIDEVRLKCKGLLAALNATIVEDEPGTMTGQRAVGD